MPDEKYSDRGAGHPSSATNGSGGAFRGGGGWVVVSFIGPAGIDVSELAVQMLRGSRDQPPALSNAPLADLRAIRKAAEKVAKDRARATAYKPEGSMTASTRASRA
jgi:hypothetical protein